MSEPALIVLTILAAFGSAALVVAVAHAVVHRGAVVAAGLLPAIGEPTTTTDTGNNELRGLLCEHRIASAFSCPPRSSQC